MAAREHKEMNINGYICMWMDDSWQIIYIYILFNYLYLYKYLYLFIYLYVYILRGGCGGTAF